MTTATTNLALGKPVIGADADAWGGELNTIFDTLDSLLAGLIHGLKLSTAGSSASFGIASGAAAGMVVATAYTKTTGAWAVGTGNGALDTGAITFSTWYHLYIIQRPDTGVVDYLISLSPSAPTMPANYTRSFAIGELKTDGFSQWALFTQNRDEFLWAIPVRDLSTAALGAAELLTVLASVPTGIVVNALLRGDMNHATPGTAILVNSVDETNAAPGAGNYTAIQQVSNQALAFGPLSVRTNTSAQVRSRSSAAITTLELSTYGWNDNRGRI